MTLVNVNGMRAYIGSQKKKNSAYHQEKIHQLRQKSSSEQAASSPGFYSYYKSKKKSNLIGSSAAVAFGTSSQSNSHILPNMHNGLLLMNQAGEQLISKSIAAQLSN